MKRGNQLVVTVGDGGLAFTPSILTANPGDIILFELYVAVAVNRPTNPADACFPAAKGITFVP